MTEQIDRIVIDTCVILDMLVVQDADRAARAEALLDGHGLNHTIVIPAIVIAEMGGAPLVRAPEDYPAEAAERIAAVAEWIRSARYVVAELSERTAKRAAHLAVKHHLRGPDASILATAEHVGCTHLYTRDKKLLRCDELFGFRIECPPSPPTNEWLFEVAQ